jgi:hypothetical protein
MATKVMNGLDLQSQRIQNIANPTSAQDAATKTYVDALINGVSWKTAARVASTSNITVASPGTTIDGVTMAANDRVLLKGQTTGTENGVYTFVASGSPMTRVLDMNASAQFLGAAIYVEEGSTNHDTAWTQTVEPFTLGTTTAVFVQLGGGTTYTAGNGILISTGVISVVANTGITVGGSGVGIDTTIVPRKYATTVSGSTSITVTHNLGTYDVHVQVYDAVGAGANLVMCDVTAATTNTVTLGFASAPTNFRCIVLG